MDALNRVESRAESLRLQYRLLSRRYLVAVVRSVDVSVRASPASCVTVYWGFGCLLDGEFELLGAWCQTRFDVTLSPELVADLGDRGVERIRYSVGTPLVGKGVERGVEFFGAAALPSIAQAMAVTVALVAPRHRQAVAGAFQTVVGASCSSSATDVLSDVEAGPWGKKYPQIVALWRLALEHWRPLFDLPASPRRLVLAADRMAAEIQGSLERAIARHGSFADSAEALEFVCAVLLRAERRLERAATSAALAPRPYGALGMAASGKPLGSAVAGFI
ncbi:transposase [Paucibacter sp. KBW04]|uniref:transposase n=1 Tax=Paucibacter sp. KBW04 TaxID=2153361 RepID=UPI0018CC0ACD|nr:transposase [Paucibacter sp. KBW04]